MPSAIDNEFLFDGEPKREKFTFGMETPRRGETFREMTNPFTGEVTRAYKSMSTREECSALAETLDRYGVDFQSDVLDYDGVIGGTRVILPDLNLNDGDFAGAKIEMSGELISDEAIAAVLEMGKAAGTYFVPLISDGPPAAPTPEIKARSEETLAEEVILVDTIAKLREWLVVNAS